jgi:hypothetical protein
MGEVNGTESSKRSSFIHEIITGKVVASALTCVLNENSILC